MDPQLAALITQFNTAQCRAVNILERIFGCPRPESRIDYTTRYVEVIRNQDYQAGGYRIRPHGYGLAMVLEGMSVDFDFGINGEIDGFDGWRLALFVEENHIETSLDTEEKIEAAIRLALSAGTIRKGAGGNYYVLAH